MGQLRITDPGVFATVQDLGRPGWSAQGVPAGGAADPIALRIGNRLLGNPDAAAAIELSLTGGTYVFEDDAEIALAGGRVNPVILGPTPDQTRPFPPPVGRIHAGEALRIGPITAGARAYLCISRGFAVPTVLGSASTLPSAALGGFRGRPLRAGDVIEFPGATRRIRPGADATPALLQDILSRRTLRATPGPHAAEFAPDAPLWHSDYSVASQSDRAGLRLSGPSIPSRSAGRLPSEGMLHGAIQVPPDGQPIILMPDHPTTGGYPVIACIASVDLPVLGQLRPGDSIRFERTTLDHARRLFREQEHRLRTEFPPP